MDVSGKKERGGGDIKRNIYNIIECAVTYLTVGREACRFESDRDRDRELWTMLFDFAWMADCAGVSVFFVEGCGVVLLLNVGARLKNPVLGCSLWCLAVGVACLVWHTGFNVGSYRYVRLGGLR